MKNFFLVLLITLLFTPKAIYADTDHARPLEEILNEIRTEQSINSNDEIACEQVNEDLLEELGDAVMAQMHPDEEVHTAMDNMMGGEGSESLKNAHISMGSRYLGCSTASGSAGMMGGGMMNSFSNNGYDRGGDANMMEWNDYGMMSPYIGGAFGILGVIFWILLIVLLIAMIRYFWRKGDRK